MLKAKPIVLSVFMRIGLCRVITTDQGTEFNNKLNTELMKTMKINHRLTTPYHPQVYNTIVVGKDWGSISLRQPVRRPVKLNYHSQSCTHFSISGLCPPSIICNSYM